MNNTKRKYYTFQDKVKYYSDILVDNKNSISKKDQAYRWIQQNLYDKYSTNSKKLSKNQLDRVDIGVVKYLDEEIFSKIYNYKKKRKYKKRK